MIYAQSVVIEGACSGYHYRGIMNNHGYLAPQGSLTNPTDNEWHDTFQFNHTDAFNAQPAEDFFVRDNSVGTPFQPDPFVANSSQGQSVFEIDPTESNSGAVSQYDCDSIVYFRDNGHLQKLALDSIVFTGSDILAVERLTKLQLFRGTEADSILQLDSILVAFADTFALTDLGKLDIAERQLKLHIAKGRAGKLAADVNTVTPLDTIASLWKELLSMAYSKWADDDSTTVLSGLDSTRLWDIGALCPYTDGPAVYLARTMLFSLDSAYFSLGHECEFPVYNEPSGKQSGEDEENEAEPSTEEKLSVRVYPNPTEGELTVRFNSDIEADHLLIITGLDGRYVSTFPLSSISSTVSLKTLSPGLYFLEISDLSGSSVFNGKIVLIE